MAIESVTAFQFISYRGAAKYDMEYGDKLKAQGKLKISRTKDQRVTVGTLKNRASTYWYFFLNGECGAYVGMESPEDEDREALESALNYTKLLVPHSSAVSLRGLGYPSYVYKKALDAGFVLASSGHSKDASKLWEAIAAKNGAEIRWVDTGGHGRKLDIWRVMIPRALRGKIQTRYSWAP